MRFSFLSKKPAAAVGGIAGGAFALLLVALPMFEGKTNIAVIPVPGDVPTLCYGYTHDVKMGDTATDEECIHYLKAEIDKALNAVDSLVLVPISEDERAAYASLVYNVGRSAFAKSTILRKVNRGDRRGGCAAMVYLDKNGKYQGWVYFHGRVVPGLVNRRLAEQELCYRGLGV